MEPRLRLAPAVLRNVAVLRPVRASRQCGVVGAHAAGNQAHDDDSRHCSAALLTDGKPSARDGVWWWAPRRDPGQGAGEAALDVMLGAGGNRGCVVCGVRISWVAHAVANWSLLLEDEERAQGSLRPVLQQQGATAADVVTRWFPCAGATRVRLLLQSAGRGGVYELAEIELIGYERGTKGSAPCETSQSGDAAQGVTACRHGGLCRLPGDVLRERLGSEVVQEAGLR